MTGEHNPLIWENDEFVVRTPLNPHIPLREGFHLVVSTQKEISAAWDDAVLAGKAFQLASEICKRMKNMELSPWFNIQANGNWGLLEGASPFFHIHIYTRNKTESWGKPITLPEAPKTYKNETMPSELIGRLREDFSDLTI